MSTTKRVIALIPARGGSQGIPRKNVRELCHRPLISWVIESALQSGIFDEIWVSTDDDEIARVSKEWGANVHRRHPETATNEASTESAMLDFLKHHTSEFICLIQATSPLTLSRHFLEAFSKLHEARADSLVTVTRSHLFLWSGNGEPLNYDPAQRPRRQDWSGLLTENGAFYFTKVRVFLETRNRLGGRRVVYEIPQEYSADIDTAEDFDRCEQALRRRLSATGCIERSTTRAGTILRARAPVRIDLAGGWTDIPLFADRFGGEVVSFAITMHSVAEMYIDAEDRLNVSYRSSTALGSGLGTTGSLNVAFLAAIDTKKSSSEELAQKAYDLEELLGNKGGRQDQWFAANGGFHHVCFSKGGVQTRTFRPAPGVQLWLKKNLLLFDSKVRRSSGELHAGIWSKLERQDKDCLAGFQLLKRAATHMARSLSANHTDGVAEALHLVCDGVDLIDERIHAPFRECMQYLQRTGNVLGWKATGAGAGGCVIVLIRSEEYAPDVRKICFEHGWTYLTWDYDHTGVVFECIPTKESVVDQNLEL